MRSVFFLFVTSFSFPVLALQTILSQVTPEQPLCYGREYSYQHLEAHPSQKVQKIQAKFEGPDQYGDKWLSLEVTLRGPENLYTNYRTVFSCLENGHCYIDCDGGSVNLALVEGFTGNGKDLLIDNQGFLLYGGCGAEENANEVYLENTKGGDDIFRLVPLPADFCQTTRGL